MTKDPAGTYGGVTIKGSTVTAQNIAGGDINVANSGAEIKRLLDPVANAIATAPTETREEATNQLNQLRNEISKGSKANDSLMAKLIDGLVNLVPTAVSSIVAAFASPILGSVAGPVTKYVLEKLRSTETDPAQPV